MGGLHSKKMIDFKHIKNWARNWEPRAKTIAAFLFVFGVVSLENPWMVLAAFVFVLSGAVMMGLGVKFLFSRLVLLAPFLFFMTIPLIFGKGFPPPEDRVVFASLIALKALTSMSAMIVMLATQPLEEFFDGLSNMKVPPLIISVLFLSCRYALLFVEEIKKIRRALASRLFNGGLNMEGLKVCGEISAGMFVKSFDRSEFVYRAMASRGFNGELPAGQPRKVTRADILKSAAAVSFILVTMVLERGVL